MKKELKVSISQYSTNGRKEINQDFHDAFIPQEPQLTYKGVAIAIADGIGSSDVSQEASKVSVTSFLMDYISTPEVWSVKKSALKVINAINSWLYSQTMKSKYYYDKNRGFVCTFSAMVVRSSTAYIFHAGDTRIYRIRDNTLECLTQDHRLWVSKHESYLSRALGMDRDVRVDYVSHQVEVGDIYIFMSDGAYEFLDEGFLLECCRKNSADFSALAKVLCDKAFEEGSGDNITTQLVRIDELPKKEPKEIKKELEEKPFAPLLEPRETFEGYTILRELSASSRSHVYLALEGEVQVAIKVPSIEMRGNRAFMERFLMEEWIARRLNSANLLKAYVSSRQRKFIYSVWEYIEGQTLSQWIIDNPSPSLEVARGIVEQIAKALQALHRQEILHQDLRPQNIMIDKNATLKIIDFGSAKVEGIDDTVVLNIDEAMMGTAMYSAPEYFIGLEASKSSDIFSLAVIIYEMLSGGNFPYGVNVARAKTKEAQKKLKYTPLYYYNEAIPIWVDGAIKKALDVEAKNRYDELSEFIYDLRHPNGEFLKQKKAPLVQRSSVTFWKAVSFVLSAVVLFLLFYR